MAKNSKPTYVVGEILEGESSPKNFPFSEGEVITFVTTNSKLVVPHRVTGGEKFDWDGVKTADEREMSLTNLIRKSNGLSYKGDTRAARAQELLDMFSDGQLSLKIASVVLVTFGSNTSRYFKFERV